MPHLSGHWKIKRNKYHGTSNNKYNPNNTYNIKRTHFKPQKTTKNEKKNKIHIKKTYK